MISLKLLLATLAVLSIWSTLPTATRCDTSYYEQYYSARRFLPLKKNPLVQVNLTLSLESETLGEFEKIAVVGDVATLGSWKANGAVIMNKTHEYGKWKATLWLNANSSINYRYFVAAQDKRKGSIQVRRWESAIQSRYLNISSNAISRSDIFGLTVVMRGAHKEIQRGWLNSGHIVQFKLFRHPLQLNDSFTTNDEQRLRIKLTPVDPKWRTAIVPSARANSEYVLMEYGNSYLRPQPIHGVLYQGKDIIVFHNTVSDVKDVAYLIEIYAEDLRNNVARIIGYQYIYPDSIGDTDGEIPVMLLSSTWMNIIGILNLQYLVIHPLSNAPVDFRTSFMQYWRDNWTGLEVGHRGLGKSLKETTTNAATILENSVASMTAVSELAGDLVEFDVQLTKDLVPIIYHDFSILVCMESKTPTSIADLTKVMIKDVTYEQLKDLTTYQVVGSKIVEYSSHNSIINETHRIFPSFEDFLTTVNKSLGFDIEIKWPQLLSTGIWESKQTIDKNLYVDSILSVMLKHGCGRLSFFTSFDADICTMIRFKQNMYPVMLLHARIGASYADPRSDTIYDAINNAQAFDLAGIVPNAVLIKNNPEWIDVAVKQHKKIFVWGAELKDRQTIEWFIDQNVTGVIYDRMDLYISGNRTSAFQVDNDLPDFFKLQCSPVNYSSRDNFTVTNILSNVNIF